MENVTMRMGTKSLLYGAHCFFLHPFFVWAAWIKLYGWSWDLRLWLCFFVHDLGYWGRAHMDDEDGERHVFFGAQLMRVFGKGWYEFCIRHSRFWCKRLDKHISRLCIADKYSVCLIPASLYVAMVRATGEIREYQQTAKHIEEVGNHQGETRIDDIVWFTRLENSMWMFVHDNINRAAVNDRIERIGPWDDGSREFKLVS